MGNCCSCPDKPADNQVSFILHTLFYPPLPRFKTIDYPSQQTLNQSFSQTQIQAKQPSRQARGDNQCIQINSNENGVELEGTKLEYDNNNNTTTTAAQKVQLDLSKHLDSQGQQGQSKTLASSPTSQTPKNAQAITNNSGAISNNNNNNNNPQSNSQTKIPSSHYIQHRNNNNNNNNFQNLSMHESGSLNGYTGKPSNHQGKESGNHHQNLGHYHGNGGSYNNTNMDSVRLDELTSLNQLHPAAARLDTQERELQGIFDSHVVSTTEQLQNNSNTKFVFLCRNDSSKSFILHVPHAQTTQPNAIELLFEIASKYVGLAYGTVPVSLELLFGMANLSRPALAQLDAFPAYFKTKETFEEPYMISIHVPANFSSTNTNSNSNSTMILNPTGTTTTATTQNLLSSAIISNHTKKQSIFPSMTVEDVKIEICRTNASVCPPNSLSVFRVAHQDEMIRSGVNRLQIEHVSSNNGMKQMLVQLHDHEKFGNSANTEDWNLVLRKDEESAVPDHFWFEDAAASTIGVSSSQSSTVAAVTAAAESSTNGIVNIQHNSLSIILTNKKSNTESDARRAVRIGVNLEIECQNSECIFKAKKQVKSLGVGVFDLLGADSKVACAKCNAPPASMIIHTIAFFACRFAYTGICDFQKKSAVKWHIAFQPNALKKLDEKDIFQASNNNNNNNSTNWTSEFNKQKWTKFKIYAKRISHLQHYEKNEEFLHELSLEADSSKKMCGICKENVSESMQHTLECAHVFHKICLNMLPSIFSNIKCPLCK